MDWKLELVSIPVSDTDRAKAFYVDQVGFVADHDHRVSDDLRFVQLTPSGSACSVQFGSKITTAPPGSAMGLYLVVSDIQAARDELAARGAKVSEVFHAEAPGAQFQPDGASGRVGGPAPDQNLYVCSRERRRRARAVGSVISPFFLRLRPGSDRNASYLLPASGIARLESARR